MAGKGIAEIILGAKGPPQDDDEDAAPESTDEPISPGVEAACSEVWDAIQAKDEEAFCRALAALHRM